MYLRNLFEYGLRLSKDGIISLEAVCRSNILILQSKVACGGSLLQKLRELLKLLVLYINFVTEADIESNK